MKALMISILLLMTSSAMADYDVCDGFFCEYKIENLNLSNNATKLNFTLRKDGTTESISCVEWGIYPLRNVYAVITTSTEKVWSRYLENSDNNLNDKGPPRDRNQTMEHCQAALQSLSVAFATEKTTIVYNEYSIGFFKWKPEYVEDKF